MKKNDVEISTLVEGFDIQDRLDLREALYGGRVECYKDYYHVTSDEKTLYQDFTSLYPSVMKAGVYPTQHPQTLLGDQIDLDNFQK